MQQRIAIDMDEVIADAAGYLLAAYNVEFDESLTLADLHGKGLSALITEERRERIDAFLRGDDTFRHFPVLPDSQEVVAALQERYEVFITTAMEFPNSFNAKYAWLREHFPFIPDSHIVFCGDKSIIRADFLIDDHPHHFARFVGQGVLYTASHNVHETRYPRVNDWREVAAMFLAQDDQ